jgi:hypothetical protein
LRYEDVPTDELVAEQLTEELIAEYPPKVLDKLVINLEKLLRRLTVQKILEEKE